MSRVGWDSKSQPVALGSVGWKKELGGSESAQD